MASAWVREYTDEEGGIVNIELKIWWRMNMAK